MHMVDVKLIKDTIDELLEANVDKETIYITLREIGVDLEDIDKYYQEAISPKTKTQEIVQEKPAKNVYEKSVTASELPRAKPKTTTEDLEKATKDVIASTPEITIPEPRIVEKIIETNSSNSELKKQISELEEKITDIKADISGLTKIMKDILEENRNILNKLK